MCYITKFNRIALGLEKSHNTDAFVIAGGTIQERSSLNFLLKQVRKCNRKLFKGNIECFVFGRRKTGYFELRALEGTKIHASAKVKDLTLLESANTFLISNLRRSTPFHTLKNMVSATLAPHRVL